MYGPAVLVSAGHGWRGPNGPLRFSTICMSMSCWLNASTFLLPVLSLEHCRTGGDDDPYTLSFRGIDNSVYYMTQEGNGAHLLNYSGCGNTVSANHPIVKNLILDSLRM